MVLDITEIEFLYSTQASYSQVPCFFFFFFFFFSSSSSSPKLQHFLETCQVKENGKHLYPKCHSFRPKEKKHEFGLHVKCCSWPSSLIIHEEHLMQAHTFFHA